MDILNIHERDLHATAAQAGELIDSLASVQDRLWPIHTWPRMGFDCVLCQGAAGGHGPIHYVVEYYRPGHVIRFQFTAPRGFNGQHGFEIIDKDTQTVTMRHTLKMTTRGLALVGWPILFRPLHDALIEDALATAQASLGNKPELRDWSLWVKLLRWLLTAGKARPQGLPAPAPVAD